MIPLSNRRWAGKVCEAVPHCPSTNDLLRQRVSEKSLPEGAVIYTLNQTAGRGQRGNAWLDEPNANLAFSILLQPTFLAATRQAWLNKAIAVATQNAISDFTDRPVTIKWPNDILIDEQKVAGILTEVTIKGTHLQQAIIGIGVNVNNQGFPEELPRAVSLFQVTGVREDPEKLVNQLCTHIEMAYEHLRAGQLGLIDKAYHAHLFLKGAYQLYEAKGETFVGAIEKVDEDGRLILKTPKGSQAFAHGTIRYRLAGFT